LETINPRLLESNFKLRKTDIASEKEYTITSFDGLYHSYATTG